MKMSSPHFPNRPRIGPFDPPAATSRPRLGWHSYNSGTDAVILSQAFTQRALRARRAFALVTLAGIDDRRTGAPAIGRPHAPALALRVSRSLILRLPP